MKSKSVALMRCNVTPDEAGNLDDRVDKLLSTFGILGYAAVISPVINRGADIFPPECLAGSRRVYCSDDAQVYVVNTYIRDKNFNMDSIIVFSDSCDDILKEVVKLYTDNGYVLGSTYSSA